MSRRYTFWATLLVLEAIRVAQQGHDEAARVRVWKLFLLLPRLLLARSAQSGSKGRAALSAGLAFTRCTPSLLEARAGKDPVAAMNPHAQKG